VVLLLIASSPTTTVAATSIASPAVEPATAISVVSMVPEWSVVSARDPTPAVFLCTTTGPKDDVCDNHDYYYRHNYEEHFHPNSPFTAFPIKGFSLPSGALRLQLTGGMRRCPRRFANRPYVPVRVRHMQVPVDRIL
jgi:hypothetical protein